MEILAPKLLREALGVLEAQLVENAQERSTVIAMVNARLRLASVATDDARIDLAKRSLATIEAQTYARNDPRLLALKADALHQAGRTAEATTLAKSLLASGYRAPVLTNRMRGMPGSQSH